MCPVVHSSIGPCTSVHNSRDLSIKMRVGSYRDKLKRVRGIAALCHVGHASGVFDHAA